MHALGAVCVKLRNVDTPLLLHIAMWHANAKCQHQQYTWVEEGSMMKRLKLTQT